MKTITLMSLGAIAATTITSQAALTWTGAGDGISLFAENNWLDNASSVPAAGTIDAGTPVTAATGGVIDINSGTGSPSAFGGHFDTGSNTLNVGGGKTVASTGTFGIRAASSSTLAIVGTSTVSAQFVLNYVVSLNGGSTLQLRGGGNALNNSTLDLLDTASILQFNDETYAAFTSEHASKVTSFGSALNFGADEFVYEAGDNAIATSINGGAGVQISAVVPEPSSTALLGLGGLALLLRRRK